MYMMCFFLWTDAKFSFVRKAYIIYYIFFSVCVQLCSGGTEHDPEAMGAEGVAGVEHQRRALQRRRRRRHRRRQQPHHQPGHQVRLLLRRQHRLPHHQTVGSSSLPILILILSGSPPPGPPASICHRSSPTVCSTKRLSGA